VGGIDVHCREDRLYSGDATQAGAAAGPLHGPPLNRALWHTGVQTTSYMVNSITKHRIDLGIVILSLLAILLIPPIGVLISFLAVIIYLLIGKNRQMNFRSVGFKVPENWLRTILLCLIFGILIELGFQIVLNPILEIATASKIDLSAYESLRGNISIYVMMIVIGWVVGGFIEEVLFRGFLLSRISKLFSGNTVIGDSIAIAITSAAFGFSHLYQGWSGVLSTGLISVIFGIIFVRTNKIIWYPVLTHGFVNMTALTLMLFGYEQKLNDLIF
jgi:CAAX protease family protein